MRRLLGEAGLPACVNRVGSMLTCFFGAEEVTRYDQAARASREQFARLHGEMLAHGVHLPPSPFEAWFVSAAHTEADIRETLSAFGESLKSVV